MTEPRCDAGTAGHGRLEDLGPLIGGVARALAGTSTGTLQQAFETGLRQLLPLRAVRLREVPPSFGGRVGTPAATAESIVLDVQTSDTDRQAVLEASLMAGHVLDPVDIELLGAAAALGALVLEVERGRPMRMSKSSVKTSALLSASSAMQTLRERVARVAPSGFTVLIEGESGTGKELVAHHLHSLSPRRSGPFVAVNCAAIVETLLEAELFGIEERTATGVRGRRGKFEAADRGTLFLDEVSDLSAAAQAKLLRAIQELSVERVGGHGSKRVDVRIIAASNRPLADLVEKGAFRADLFYRLSGVEITVPPLRVRDGDIPELVSHFLGLHDGGAGLVLLPAAVEAMRMYGWPGNVRELQRLIERLVALAQSPEIGLDDLPPHVRGRFSEVLETKAGQDESLRAWGTRYVRLVYERCGRNKRRTCHTLGISYHTLSAYLRCGDPAAGEGRQLPAWVARSCSVAAGHGSSG
ncbi:MAG: sigma 54-interacting transcriptional regulator [Vicinamibacterales bacterium]